MVTLSNAAFECVKINPGSVKASLEEQEKLVEEAKKVMATAGEPSGGDAAQKLLEQQQALLSESRASYELSLIHI